MAATLETPTDQLTGMPLPIAPTSLNPGSFDEKNNHHHFHPKNSPILQTPAGLAVRDCRVQYVRTDLHDRYHRLFVGPPLPETEEESFKAAVLAVAGVVPRTAIDLSKPGEHGIVSLENREYYKVAQQSVMHPSKKQELSRFFALYATKQDVESRIENRDIDEFLDENTSRQRRLELAREVFLHSAVELSLQDLTRTHSELRQEGLVVQRKRESVYAVVRRFIRTYALSDFSEALNERLIST